MSDDWPSAPLPPSVTFNYASWIALFPDFANVSSAFATGCWSRASYLCQNNADSPVVLANAGDTSQLQYFLNLLTAHIVWLNAPQINGQPNDGVGSQAGSPLVGRISQATEGSVTVATEMPNQPQGAAYYLQTKWGLEYWAASAAYRQGPYISRRRSWYRASNWPVVGSF